MLGYKTCRSVTRFKFSVALPIQKIQVVDSSERAYIILILFCQQNYK